MKRLLLVLILGLSAAVAAQTMNTDPLQAKLVTSDIDLEGVRQSNTG